MKIGTAANGLSLSAPMTPPPVAFDVISKISVSSMMILVLTSAARETSVRSSLSENECSSTANATTFGLRRRTSSDISSAESEQQIRSSPSSLQTGFSMGASISLTRTQSLAFVIASMVLWYVILRLGPMKRSFLVRSRPISHHITDAYKSECQTLTVTGKRGGPARRGMERSGFDAHRRIDSGTRQLCHESHRNLLRPAVADTETCGRLRQVR